MDRRAIMIVPTDVLCSGVSSTFKCVEPIAAVEVVFCCSYCVGPLTLPCLQLLSTDSSESGMHRRVDPLRDAPDHTRPLAADNGSC